MPEAKAIALPLELRRLLAGLEFAQVADDQQWIVALLRAEGQRVVTLLWRMLGREQDVLDAYQTAVCQITGRGRDAVRSNLGGYFYRTAINAGIGILRDRRQRREHWPALVDARGARDASSGPATPLQILDQRQTLERMRQAIYLLPPHLREVILLRDMAELPYMKVAAMLNIRSGTARLYRHQAVVRLAGLMGKEAVEHE
jgi:RNA polymerase sigma-70 factor (ECF subfamily)